VVIALEVAPLVDANGQSFEIQGSCAGPLQTGVFTEMLAISRRNSHTLRHQRGLSSGRPIIA
jgi:hypothetical protein